MGLSCKFSLKPIHWYFWCGSYGYFWWLTNLISVEIWGSPICFALKDHCATTHQDLAKSDLKAAKQGVAALSALSVACHFRQSLRKLWPGGDGSACENRGGCLNFWHPQIQFYQFFHAWMATICAQTFQPGKTPIENCWVNPYFAGSISKIQPKHDGLCLSEGFLRSQVLIQILGHFVRNQWAQPPNFLHTRICLHQDLHLMVRPEKKYPPVNIQLWEITVFAR